MALWLALRAVGVSNGQRRWAGVALGTLALQGALGYATYFSHVQVDVTEAHIVGGALVVAALTRFHLGLCSRSVPTGAVATELPVAFADLDGESSAAAGA